MYYDCVSTYMYVHVGDHEYARLGGRRQPQVVLQVLYWDSPTEPSSLFCASWLDYRGPVIKMLKPTSALQVLFRAHQL